MAQGAVASLPSNGTMALSAEELHEILECEKIMRFRDAVLAGTHPRIKVPAHLINGKNATRQTSSPSSAIARPNPPQVQAQVEANTVVTGTYMEDNHSLYNPRPSSSLRMSTSRPAAPMAKAEINPILLEKSDDLIKAEIQLQRQRLERALREQVEQRRLSVKAASQTSESLPDFDISDVLSKALTLVHPSTAAEDEQAAADHASASDSFDENTFYSSQHDTPEQSILSQEHSEISNHSAALGALHSTASTLNTNNDGLSNVLMANVSLSNSIKTGAYEDAAKRTSLLQRATQTASQRLNLPSMSITNSEPAAQTQIESVHTNHDEDMSRPTSNDARTFPEVTVSSPSYGMSGVSKKALEDIANSITAQTSALLKRKFHETESSVSAEILEAPIVRTRDDVPTLAPQPARVSPLATARAPPVISHSIIAEEAPPTQITVTSQSLAVSSPDSSAKGAKPSEKKKKKKKARKSSGKQPAMVDTPDSPYIKPEPRSPSPFSAAPLPRPLPRQRHTLQHVSELNYDEPRYEVSRDVPREQSVSSRSRIHEIQPVYDRSEVDRAYEAYKASSYDYRHSGEIEKQPRRVVSQNLFRIPSPPQWNPLPSDSRPMRAASHTAVEQRMPLDSARYYRDIPPRASVRTDADRERSRSPITRKRRSPIMMAPPPRFAAPRIVVDEYGHEYYAPASIPIPSRQSAAPAIRSGDEDIIYERASTRPVARPITNVYDEDGVIYRRPSPQLAPARRVITQPEPDTDYRSYRQREYSTRPLARAAPSEEYIRVREPLERRQMSHFEEMPGENVARMGSVRPESARYTMPREYITRVQSVRPEAHPQDYRASVRPEARREVTVAPIREYSGRPGEPEIIRRECMPPLEGAYAPARPVVRRLVGDGEYMERRREAPQDIYVDEVRRDVVYR